MTDILDNSYESDLTDEEHEQLSLMSEHAIAPPLSPEARTVFEAFNSVFDWVEDGVPGPQFSAIAAALRAAVDEVISSVPPPCDDFDEHAQGFQAAHLRYRNQLLVIATELEAQ